MMENSERVNNAQQTFDFCLHLWHDVECETVKLICFEIKLGLNIDQLVRECHKIVKNVPHSSQESKTKGAFHTLKITMLATTLMHAKYTLRPPAVLAANQNEY